MNIVFLTLAYPIGGGDRNIYTDLMDEMAAMGHSIKVFRPDEGRSFGAPSQSLRKGIQIVSVPTGRLTKAPVLAKAINTILLEKRYTRALRSVFSERIDVVIYSTPPISFVSSVRELKRETGCLAYLMLKDIFPQNAVDVGMIAENGIVHRYFRHKEMALYSISDLIGCMSPANVAYFLLHNPGIPSARVHICPNAIEPTIESCPATANSNRIADRAKGCLHLIYGGNLGKPQGVSFILKALQAIDSMKDVSTTLVGSGTEYGFLKKGIAELGLNRVRLMSALPKNDYIDFLASGDAGLVFLDERFTIPNFPSRILDYLDCGLPIIACTDRASDVKEEICEAGAGLWSQSGDIVAFAENVRRLQGDVGLRRAMSGRAKEILKEKYSVETAAVTLLSAIASVKDKR